LDCVKAGEITMNPTMTLAQIRAERPCVPGWTKLLCGLGYTDGQYDPERVVSLGDVATINDAADAWWCVRCLDWTDITVRRAVLSVLLLSIRRVTSSRPRYLADLARWCDGDDAVDLQKVKEAGAAARAAARAARAAAEAAEAAAEAAEAAWVARAEEAAEHEQQRTDLIAAFPPIISPSRIIRKGKQS
jgi:hypothetical protein